GSLIYATLTTACETAAFLEFRRVPGRSGIAGNGDDASVVQTFTVSVTAVNDVPTLAPIANPAAILEDASAQTVNLAGISAGGGEIGRASCREAGKNPGVAPNPNVTYTQP